MMIYRSTWITNVIVVRHSSLNISDNYTLQNEEEFEDTKGGNQNP